MDLASGISVVVMDLSNVGSLLSVTTAPAADVDSTMFSSVMTSWSVAGTISCLPSVGTISGPPSVGRRVLSFEEFEWKIVVGSVVSFDSVGSVAIKVVLEIAQDIVLTDFVSSRLDWFAVGVGSKVLSTLLLVTLSVFCIGSVVMFRKVTVEGAEGSCGIEVLAFICKVTVRLPSTLVTAGVVVVQMLRLPTSV